MSEERVSQRKQKKCKIPKILLIISIVIIILGRIFSVRYPLFFLIARKTEGWAQTNGSEVSVSYNVGNEGYHGTITGIEYEPKGFLMPYNGEPITVYYNPFNPSDTRARIGYLPGALLEILGIILLAISVVILLVCKIIRKNDKVDSNKSDSNLNN